MKKILLLFTLLIIVSMHISAKNFYYKGISLEYKKGNLVSSGDGIETVKVIGTIEGVSLTILAEKLKNGESGTDAASAYLDEVQANLENMEGDLRIERSGSIKDGILNGIEGQQIDMVFKVKNTRVGERIFCYIQNGWRVSIIFAENGKEINEKKFISLLKTFNFTPE